jgi:PAS domain S-box-containing protein
VISLVSSLGDAPWWVGVLIAGVSCIGGALSGIAAFWGASRRQRSESEDAASLRAKRVFETFHSGMLVVDRDLKIVLANRQARAITGYVDLVGHSVDELIPEGLREAHRVHVARYFDDPHTRRMGTSGMRLSLVDKFGREKAMRLSLTPMENEYGGMEVTVGMEVILP